MKYFAYGSNMNPDLMRKREISFTMRKRAVLINYRLEFNKVATQNPEEGFANIVPDKNGITEGILYEISNSDLTKLDGYEGYPDHYKRITAVVQLNNEQKIEAVTYVANSDKVREGLRPSREYLNHLLKGCDVLSEEYCQRLKNWKTLNSKSEKEILEEFIHENTELEQLEEIVDEFNIFNALDIVNNEIRHSNFLSWLMSPNESHGLGDYFLTSFLKKVASKASSLEILGPSVFDIDSWNFDDAEIVREWKNIDIIIKCDNQKFICVIENKIYSKEHSEQLQRYKDIIKKEYPDYKKFFVYLTIEGDIPSDSEYLPLSYIDIVPLIEHLIKSKKNKLSAEILSFISHYKDMLRRYVMKDSEIQDICRKIYKRHKKALDIIFEYKPDKLLEIHDCLVDIIQKDPDLILDDSSKSYIRFIPKNLDFIQKKGDGWTRTNRILLFELNNNSNGVDLYLIIGPGPQDIREKLYAIAKRNLSLFNKSKRNLTKQWFTIYKKSILRPKEYEDKEAEEIRKLIEEKLTKFKSLDLPKIEYEIKKYNEYSV